MAKRGAGDVAGKGGGPGRGPGAGLGGGPRRFKTTHWPTIRLAALPHEREALAEFCRTYWYPIYSFIRGQGLGPVEAEDVTQDFFVTMFKPGALAVADPDRGKFRTWLRSCARFHFLNYLDRRNAPTGGPRSVPLSIDGLAAEEHLRLVLTDDSPTPDQIFDRSWALTVTKRAFACLREDYEREGRGDLFRDLHARLSGEETDLSDADRSLLIGQSVNAIKTERSRRKDEMEARYRECLRAEIGMTVSNRGAVDAEIRHLLDVLDPTTPNRKGPK
jgi:RNA polymerase sigma-70 factor (ECF subfamily)